MKNILQQNLQEIALKYAIEREELLIKKYDQYRKTLKEKILIDMVSRFQETSRDHIRLIIDKMEKINPQGSLKQ